MSYLVLSWLVLFLWFCLVPNLEHIFLSLYLPSFLFTFVSFRAVMFWRSNLMQEAYYWPQQYSSLWSPKVCRLCGLFVEVGLTTMGTQEGGTDSRPICLTDSDSHDCAGPTVCKGKDLAS